MQVLAHNLVAQFTNRQLNITTNQKAKSSEKLSSGYRINRSADDAAGLAISEKMRKQVRGLNQASENVQDGISLCQVADGALGETTEILQRMRQLSVQAANGTNSESDRSAIQQEIDQLTKEVDRVANTTSFNESIYPLMGRDIGENGLRITDIPLDAMSGFYVQGNITSTGTEYKNLSQYIYGTPPNQCIDVKIQLNAKTNELELYTLDGTKIFSGDCGIGSHPQDISNIPKVRKNYMANCKYSFDATLTQPSSYFTTGTFSFDIEINRSMDIAGMNSLLRKSTFTFFVDNNKLDNLRHRLDDNSNSNIVGAEFSNVDNNRAIWIQAGADTGDGLTLSMVNATAKGLGIKEPDISVMSEANCDDAMNRLGDAIEKVSSYRSLFGAQQNRLECAKAIDDNTAENTTAAESRIRDTDMAKEMVGFSKNNILAQVGQSMLAQANQSTQGILSLLQ